MSGYIGVNNVARKITGGYIGVNGIARKIKQIYIGVNNVARLVWKAVGNFIGWTNLVFSSDNKLVSYTTSSHDTPYVSTATVKKVKDNEFICYGSIYSRQANASATYDSYRQIVTTDDNGCAISDGWSMPYDAYYMNGYYYFIPFNTYLNSSYPIVKNTSLINTYQSSNTTIYTPAFSDKYDLVNYCKVDDNVFAAYCRHYSSSSYRHVLLLFNSDGLITNSYTYNNTETYINSTSANQYSKLYYVKDRILTCVVGTNLYIIDISSDYKTRTVTSLNLGSFAYNGTTYTSYTPDNFMFYNGNIIATFDVEYSYPEFYNRVFIPIKVDYNNKTFSIGTSKLVENCGSVGLCDNSFIKNNTLVLFTKKQTDGSTNYGHCCFLMPYDSETNTFGDYTSIVEDNLPSGDIYDTYHGFIPIKEDSDPTKLFIFDTVRTEISSGATWQFYYRTGSITLN